MRRIASKEEKDKKDSRNRVIIGLILVALMVFGTAGYAFYSKTDNTIEKKTEGGVEFISNGAGMWEFEVQGVKFLTQYTLEDTRNVSVFVFKTITDYSQRPLFFLDSGVAREELTRNLRSVVPRIQDGCIKDYEDRCEENAPIKECSIDNVLIIEDSEEIKISQEENCILIQAPYDEQLRVADAFLFKILGIKS